MKSTSGTTYIIAEAGVNHDGDVVNALKLVDVAARAGADAVKFQTFKADRLAATSANLAPYQQIALESADTQLSMLQRLELSDSDFFAILGRCNDVGIEFLSTPFDPESLDFLVRLGVHTIKVGSGDITNAALLRKIGLCGLPVILSTGMATLSEVENALTNIAAGYLAGVGETLDPLSAYVSSGGQDFLGSNVSLLHCTTAYPTPYGLVNLRAMDTLGSAFGLQVGYSDHTDGFEIAVAAVARGARVIEKHITLDRNAIGPDHISSLEPKQFASMVSAIRNTESALGSHIKVPTTDELAMRTIVRKSLVAAAPITAGECYSTENLTVKRANGGVSAAEYFTWLGRRARRDYVADEMIDE